MIELDRIFESARRFARKRWSRAHDNGAIPSGIEAAPPRSRIPVVRTDGRAIGYREHQSKKVLPSAVIIVFYVTPTPNQWRESTGATPQFDAHVQPRFPGDDLGFYDFQSILRRQVSLARDYGISGFCFDYSEESGEPQPIDCFLGDASLNLTFCVRWTGSNDPPDRIAPRLKSFMADPRYLKIDGKPCILVDRKQKPAQWRDMACKTAAGDVFLASFQSCNDSDPRERGFDIALANPMTRERTITANQTLINRDYAGEVFDWRDTVRDGLQPLEYPAFRLVSTGWDDEPSNPGTGSVFLHASPRRYRDWLRQTIRENSSIPVFVSAFNDWKHGAVLEPDSRLGYAYLHATRDALMSPGVLDSRPCAAVHVYHVELLDEIVAAITKANLDFRLIVTTPFDRADWVRARLKELRIEAELETYENRGRDILPFLRVANRLLDEGVQTVLKLHTKHSGHREDGAQWRGELIGRLVEQARASRILDAFAEDPQLGFVVPEGHLLPLSFYWDANEEAVRYLCTRMGIMGPDTTRDRFAAGSMFWVRLEAIRPLLDAHLGEWEFAPEAGHVDGTMAHAVERVLSLSVKAAGYKTEVAANICGIPFTEEETYARTGSNTITIRSI